MTSVTEAPPAGRQSIWSAGTAVKLAVSLAIPLTLLFWVSGHWDWVAAWVYLAVLLAGMIAAMFVFAKLQPGLLEERHGHWRDSKRWDRPLVAIIGLVGPLSVQLVSGLDKRFGWSAAVPLAWQVFAGAASLAGVALTAWAMAVNPFFSSVVRIQSDRGHRVVAAGPYRAVRHPGYVGMLLVTLGTPVLLGTLWALVPAGTVVATFVLRTALEDATLRRELPGYAEYALRVRSRLIPRIW